MLKRRRLSKASASFVVSKAVSQPLVCSACCCHLALVPFRNYGILELQKKYGPKFHRIKSLAASENPTERRVAEFAMRIGASPDFDREVVITAENEIMPQEGEQKTKPNMRKIVEQTYNWNPYHKRISNGLGPVPEEYRQSGWGMQSEPRTNTPDVYKMFPNTDILKNAVTQGFRVKELGHLLTNPLLEGGHRLPDIAAGRDFDPIESIVAQSCDNVVESWPGQLAIDAQKQLLPEESISTQKIHEVTKKQVLMRRLKEASEKAFAERLSLPPFKYGFEDVPVVSRQRNIHAPDYTGEHKRTREQPAVLSIWMKHVWSERSAVDTRRLHTAMIHLLPFGSKVPAEYNPYTTELKMWCTDCYFHEDNVQKVLDRMSKIVFEVERVAKITDAGSGQLSLKTWDAYYKKFGKEIKREGILRSKRRAAFSEEMTALPKHVRSNYNLYQSGARMRKVARYLDLMYADGFVDASCILQREGPLKGNAMNYFCGILPRNNDNFVPLVDEFPENPKDYMRAARRHARRQKRAGQKRFKYVQLQSSASTDGPAFGLRSGYSVPPTEVTKEFGDWHVPLALPFTGMRLRKSKITPWTHGHLMQCYQQFEQKKVTTKMIFGSQNVRNEDAVEREMAKKYEMKKQQKEMKHLVGKRQREAFKKKLVKEAETQKSEETRIREEKDDSAYLRSLVQYTKHEKMKVPTIISDASENE